MRASERWALKPPRSPAPGERSPAWVIDRPPWEPGATGAATSLGWARPCRPSPLSAPFLSHSLFYKVTGCDFQVRRLDLPEAARRRRVAAAGGPPGGACAGDAHPARALAAPPGVGIRGLRGSRSSGSARFLPRAHKGRAPAPPADPGPAGLRGVRRRLARPGAGPAAPGEVGMRARVPHEAAARREAAWGSHDGDWGPPGGPWLRPPPSQRPGDDPPHVLAACALALRARTGAPPNAARRRHHLQEALRWAHSPSRVSASGSHRTENSPSLGHAAST